MENQVISKKRVTDHGEVFTHQREVKAMLDLVKQETERIDSLFLEPACGTGNFLAEVLKRKLRVVLSRYRESQLEYERNAVLAVSSLYGIDILQDNAVICRKRLFNIFETSYTGLFELAAKEECRDTVRYILDRNIINGDALTFKTVGDKPKPIVFTQWSLVNGSMLKRREFAFHSLLDPCSKRNSLFFSDLGDTVIIPEPIQDHPLIHFLRLADAESQL